MPATLTTVENLQCPTARALPAPVVEKASLNSQGTCCNRPADIEVHADLVVSCDAATNLLRIANESDTESSCYNVRGADIAFVEGGICIARADGNANIILPPGAITEAELKACVGTGSAAGSGIPPSVSLASSFEGVVTSVPTTVSNSNRPRYIWDVDTSGGDIDLSSIALTGFPDGAEAIFRSTGENNILFSQLINGAIQQYVAQGVGSLIKLAFDGTDFQVVG